MIIRVWCGWTTFENADAYERLLREEVLPGIQQKSGQGYRGARLLRRELDSEIEFMTMLSFESWQAVQDFTGPDYERAYVPQEARALLSRYDSHSRHYEERL